jgi:hypothetical protein
MYTNIHIYKYSCIRIFIYVSSDRMNISQNFDKTESEKSSKIAIGAGADIYALVHCIQVYMLIIRTVRTYLPITNRSFLHSHVLFLC